MLADKLGCSHRVRSFWGCFEVDAKVKPDVDAVRASLRNTLRDVPGFPSAEIVFKDISPLLARPGALADAVSILEPDVFNLDVEAVLAIDARGFVLGAAIADRLRCGLVMVRKPGKLPGSVDAFDYTCEYCSGRLEVTSGLLHRGLRCLVVDDVLATGGTARATADYAASKGGNVVGYAFLLEIEALRGREKLFEAPVESVLCC